MANSKYEYVRQFEQSDILIPNTWIVIRIDGRGFHKFSRAYNFAKPNDVRALTLMNDAAIAVLNSLPDICVAYGYSDEYSFVLKKHSTLFERRSSKLVTTIVSTFTAAYVHLWPSHFPSIALKSSHLPTFDGRAILYPNLKNLRDYLSWRQADCHVNNLYNTTFWALVQQGGVSNSEAERQLSGTVSSDKNEILFSRFQINYNNEPQIFRKGSVIFRDIASTISSFRPTGPEVANSSSQSSAKLAEATEQGAHAVENEYYVDSEDNVSGFGVKKSKSKMDKERKKKAKAKITVDNTDIIGDGFWNIHSSILEC